MAHHELGDTLYKIEDDLTDMWVEELALKGIQSIETYLKKRLEFDLITDETDAQNSTEPSSEQASQE